MQTNHLAVLVRNLEAVSSTLPDSCTRHALEEQPTEGTLEQYITIGNDRFPALLLLQAIADGPYRRALEKRGPGLHHIGCVCHSIEDETAALNAANILLHPVSHETRKYGTVWFYRPGMPFLIELTENTEQEAGYLEQATVLLPKAISIPDYAGGLSSNLAMESTENSSLVVRVGNVEMCIDPNAG